MPTHSTDGISRLDELMRFEPPRPAAPPPQPAVDPAVRRRRRRRTALIAGLVAVVLTASAGGYSAWALNAPIGTATLVSEQPIVEVPAAARLDFDGDALAGAVSVVSGGDGYLPDEAHGLWGSLSPDEVRPMASVTKLITALVILDAKSSMRCTCTRTSPRSRTSATPPSRARIARATCT